MLNKIIRSSTDFLINCHVIEEDDRDVYEYGFESLYHNIIDIISIAVIALWFHMVVQVIVYHVAFICLRSSAGGYHSKTHLRCFFMSTAILLLSLLGISQISSSLFCIFIAALSLILIWLRSPLEHENSPLNPAKKARLKTISKIFSLIFFIVILVMSLIDYAALDWIMSSLTFGIASHILLFVSGLIQSRKKT